MTARPLGDTIPWEESPIRRIALIVSILAVSVAAYGQGRLDGTLRKRLSKALRAYVKSEDPSKERWALAVLEGGRPGLAWLKEKNGKRPETLLALAELEKRAEELLGEDILRADPKVSPWTWYPNLLQVGEMLLLKRSDGTVAGLRVLADPYPGDGKLAYQWWVAKKGSGTLAGGKEGTSRAVGKEASRPWRPQSGWTEYEFALEFGGFQTLLRWVGPLHLLIRLDGRTALALPGTDSPRSVRLKGRRAPRFLHRPPPSWLRVATDLQSYLFRLLPGCTPLRLKAGEKAGFAHFESVQVRMRLPRGKGEPLVLVHLLEPDDAGLLPQHLPLLKRFLKVLLPGSEPSLLIMGGEAPAMEGNRFFGGSGWAPPTPEQVRLLRREFSEDS